MFLPHFAPAKFEKIPAEELVEEGFVREIISKIQTMRKDSDFNVMDRINVALSGNEKVLEIAKANAQKAGVADKIIFKRADIKDFSPETETGTLICNPPYGERLEDKKDLPALYK
mgnify:CR=1 FL=1